MSGLDESIIDAMLETETRPRCLQTEKAILLVMRGINLNPEAESEDMVCTQAKVSSWPVPVIHGGEIHA